MGKKYFLLPRKNNEVSKLQATLSAKTLRCASSNRPQLTRKEHNGYWLQTEKNQNV